MNDLKPCPFCGDIPYIEQIGKNKLHLRCHCGIEKTQAVLRYSLDWLRNKIIEDWNKRI